MKKFTKFIYFILAFALITCMSIFNPVITSVDAEETITSDKMILISSINVPDVVKETSDFKIAMPNVTGTTGVGTKTSIEVTDKSGTKFEYVVGDLSNDNNKYFTLLGEEFDEDLQANKIVDVTESATSSSQIKYVRPAKLSRGHYVVRYKVVDNGKTYYSSSQHVQVEGVTYSWQMEEENTKKNIIPTVTAAGASYTLPLPKIKDSDDNVVYDFARFVEVVESETVEDDEEKVKASIVVSKNNNALKVNEDPEFKVENGKIIFTPTLASNGETTTYVVKYKSSENSLADKKFTIKVESGRSNKATLEISTNKISKAQVGALTTFPTINVTDKTNSISGVEVNTTIVIKRGDGSEYLRFAPNQYSYPFTEEAEDLYVYYEVEDAYGNTAVSKGAIFSIEDRAPYIIDYAEDYTIDADDPTWEENVVTGASYLIPSEIGFGGFYLPAVYAKDYVDGHDLTFNRVLKLKDGDSSVSYNIDKAEQNAYLKNLGAGDNTDHSKAIKFEFPVDDPSIYANKTFTVEYSATDKHGNVVYATRYDIKIADNEVLPYNIDKGLTITFPTIIDRIDPKEELTFDSASAKESPEDDEAVADPRIDVKTYYYYGTESSFNEVLAKYKEAFDSEKYNEKYAYDFESFLEKLNSGYEAEGEYLGVEGVKTYKLNSKSGKTTLVLQDYDSATSGNVVTVFAVGINDQGQFVYKTQEVEIKNTIEINAPTIVEDSVVSYYDEQLGTSRVKFDQNETVILPSIQFEDLEDGHLEVSADCYVILSDNSIKYLDVNIMKFIENGIAGKILGADDSTVVGYGAEVDAIYAGTYYITYTATDDAGNKTSYFSTFEVANTTKPHIQVENGSNISIDAGEEVRLVLGLVGGGDVDPESVKYDIDWGTKAPSGLGSAQHAYKFNKAGTYIATISANYTMNGKQYTAEPSVTVTINVANPKIKWDENVDDLLENTIADINEKVILPEILAGDAVVTRKVTHTDDKGNVTDVELLQDADTFEWYFNATTNGVYKVTFVASNEYDSSDEKSYTITCGDYYEPIITIANNKLQDSNITYNNKDITFKVESFKQKEDEEGEKIPGEYILKVVATESGNTVFSYDIAVHLDDQNELNRVVELDNANTTFTLRGPSYSSNGTNNWTISGVGSYELKMTVKDANGNSATKSITFTVSSKTEPKEKDDNVVGIVLIVISAIILSGVILFFALAGKRKPKKRVSKTETAKKD